MKRLLNRWLVDTVRLYTEQQTTDVDPTTGQPTLTQVGLRQTRALVRQELAERTPGEGRVFGIRDLAIKIPETVLVQTGDRLEIVKCDGDTTLDGKRGVVVDVVRDTIQAVRRITVRMDTSV